MGGAVPSCFRFVGSIFSRLSRLIEGPETGLRAAAFATPVLALAVAACGAPAEAADAAPGSQAKTFIIAPEQSKQAFMCAAGSLESVLATAVAEYRPVSVILLDRDGKTIPDDTWAQAAGFRLRRNQDVKVRVIMICGP
jgi:hypothetical protein